MPQQDNIIHSASVPDAPTNEHLTALHALINATAEGIFIVNEEGVIEVINALAASFFGTTKHVLVGQKWLHFLHENFRDHYENTQQQWKNSSSIPLNMGPKEVVIDCLDGSCLEADLSLSRLPDMYSKSGSLYMGVLHDLTEHKKTYRALKEQATTDHLTGLANRHQLSRSLQQIWHDCLSQQQPVSLIMIDIDYFKSFNDHYGHIQGDKCLQKIAGVITDCLPSRDSVGCRYGGEEFVIVLPRCNATNAQVVAKCIQRQVKSLMFVDQGLCHTVNVSVSQGIACDENGQYRTSEALLCAADTALYRAKSDGRDRINNSA
ncbi:diguanylate cyclase [Alteromonas pelagimontana]|uniref:diguanylate cyclase n=1 Tax=Alteromonas pelagimontana TaxID=1858656 RepID=A0A6M4M9P4_9ALTE|nr:diguanylate cyclase [Alteromonas pelagimontana]QJR79837.1 diguanylate cyclase [Alteromonas pelagimontana]